MVCLLLRRVKQEAFLILNVCSKKLHNSLKLCAIIQGLFFSLQKYPEEPEWHSLLFFLIKFCVKLPIFMPFWMLSAGSISLNFFFSPLDSGSGIKTGGTKLCVDLNDGFSLSLAQRTDNTHTLFFSFSLALVGQTLYGARAG